ncbi:MAG: radical SAM family heme chaperone HemW [Candidatus Binatia bacterium]
MSAFCLYVHIPYCQAKCLYCDFNSYAAEHWPEARYVAALCAELRHYAHAAPWGGSELRTVFFGGGTPSLFTPRSIGAVLDTAQRLWPCDPNAEITLETNPGTVGVAKLRDFRVAGVNRVSFGVQSFHAHHLHRLGRIHSVDEALAIVDTARQAGVDNIGIDLIFALPQQTVKEWERDLVQACALHPDHISAYGLTYEEGTRFHTLRAEGVLRQLPEEIEAAMFTGAQEILAAHGYAQYEISNYARPGYVCRHNLNYWCGGLYLGIGAGAHSYARLTNRAPGRRWSNKKTPAAYMAAVEQHGHARSAVEELTVRQARGEFVFLGLRCLDGFAAADFHARFGAELAAVFPHVTDLCGSRLLRCSDGRWQLTPQGVLLADSVFATFL